MSTFITRLDGATGTLRLVVKDCIDVAGVPTTAGSKVLAAAAEPARRDAACLAGFRAAGTSIVGKANLHELCFGATGVNPHFGTPVNPLDAARVPGGSSSGSAVAVATGDADVALGTDTTGSVRNPAAYCGVVGIRPTFGLVPTAGTRALAPSLDTVGVLARRVAEVAHGLSLAAPAFVAPRSAEADPGVIGRLRLPGTDPRFDRAIDAALAAAELAAVDVALPGWDGATAAARTILFAEALVANAALVRRTLDELSPDVAERFRHAAALRQPQVAAARLVQRAWRGEVASLLGVRVDALALPAMLTAPPLLRTHTDASNPATLAASLLSGPALAMPVPCAGSFPASLQLLAPTNADARLLALAARIEAAVATLPPR